MIQPCRAPGCTASTTRYGHFCPTHKSNLRRHGHPEQSAVTKAELKPFVALVRKRIEKNAENATWAHCEARWLAVADHARGIVAQAQRGLPGNRHERIAAQQVAALADTVSPRDIIETTFAVFLLQDHDPRRFRSDDAFRAQLVRRLRGLSEGNIAEWTGSSDGRPKRAQRDIPPKSAAIIGQWIAEAVGGVGVHLARLEERDRKEREARAGDLAAAMRELQ